MRKSEGNYEVTARHIAYAKKIIIRVMKEIASTFVELIKEAFLAIKCALERINGGIMIAKSKDEQRQKTRSSWEVDWDTRKISQVIDKKPMFINRKVIR